MNQRNMTENTAEIIDHCGSPQDSDVDFVIPVYNEEEELETSIRRLGAYLSGMVNESGVIIADGVPANFSWQIVIADNASTDATWSIASELSHRYPDRIRAVRIREKGRGLALKSAWGESKSQVCAYMDVDLSTGLEQIDSLILPLLSGEADIAIGSRLLAGSWIKRSARREFISRSYNFLLRTYSRARFHDAQCGFKAIRRQRFQDLLPLIVDNEWFFDTELLLLAQDKGWKIKEIPVRWVEDRGTTVKIFDTAWKDLQGMKRMKTFRNSTTPEQILSHQADAYRQTHASAFAGSLIPISLLGNSTVSRNHPAILTNFTA